MQFSLQQANQCCLLTVYTSSNQTVTAPSCRVAGEKLRSSAANSRKNKTEMYQQNFPPFSTQKGEKTHLPCHSTPLCPQTKKAVWDYSKTVATTELLHLKTQALCLQGPCSCTSNRRLPDRRGGLTSSFLSINEILLRVNTFLQKLSVITSMTEYHKKKSLILRFVASHGFQLYHMYLC